MAGRPKKVQTETKPKDLLFAKPTDKGFPQGEPILLRSNVIETKPIEKAVDKEIVDDFFNHVIEQSGPKPIPNDAIYEKYIEMCNLESDINELLPYIFDIACQCESCVEFGVRRPTSTYAFLAAKPKRLVSYDIGRYDEEVSEVERLCKEAGQHFEFILGSSAHVTIEETDCCLIDTLHTKKMLETELALHADKVKKFILLHDTFGPYWETGEAPYNDETSPYGGGLGLKYAIEPFLESHPEWTVFAKYDFNNGLMILKKN